MSDIYGTTYGNATKRTFLERYFEEYTLTGTDLVGMNGLATSFIAPQAMLSWEMLLGMYQVSFFLVTNSLAPIRCFFLTQ